MNAGKIPNFFIVGAPRCGTTSMYSWLRSHPDIFMSDQKEPSYFATDIRHKFTVTDKKVYESLFKEAGNRKAVGEASALHLYSKVAAGNIHAFNPEAKIIIMLRRPVDIAYSLYGLHYSKGHDRHASFADALEAESRIEEGKESVPEGISPEVFLYRKTALLGEQVERYKNIFPERQIKYIVFDDLKTRTAETYRDTLEFLGVDAGFTPTFTKANSHSEIRSTPFNLFVRKWRPPVLQKTVRLLLPEKMRHLILTKLIKINCRKAPRPPLDTELEEELCSYFRNDITLLSKLIGRDLSHWLKVQTTHDLNATFDKA